MFVIHKVENDAINQQIGWYIGFLYKQLSFQGKCFDVTAMSKRLLVKIIYILAELFLELLSYSNRQQ